MTIKSKWQRVGVEMAHWHFGGRAALTENERAFLDAPLSEIRDGQSWESFYRQRSGEEAIGDEIRRASATRALQAGGIDMRWAHYRKVKNALKRYRNGRWGLNRQDGYHPEYRAGNDALRAYKRRMEAAVCRAHGWAETRHTDWPSVPADAPADERGIYLLVGLRLDWRNRAVQDTSELATICAACINKDHLGGAFEMAVIDYDDCPHGSICDECYAECGYDPDADNYADSFGDTR